MTKDLTKWYKETHGGMTSREATDQVLKDVALGFHTYCLNRYLTGDFPTCEDGTPNVEELYEKYVDEVNNTKS